MSLEQLYAASYHLMQSEIKAIIDPTTAEA
jgi:hypothetical protein